MILGMNQHRPDIRLGVGQRQALELVAAIGAAEKPLGTADEDGVVVAGMNRDRVHLGPLGKAIGQLLPALVADGLAKDAAEAPAMRHAGRRRHAGVNMRRTCHRFLLSFVILGRDPQA